MQHNQGETFINYNDPLVIVIFHIFYFYYCLFLPFWFSRLLVRLFFCLINYILIWCWSQSEIMQIFKSFLCLIFPQQFVIHSLTVFHSLLVAASYMESFLYMYIVNIMYYEHLKKRNRKIIIGNYIAMAHQQQLKRRAKQQHQQSKEGVSFLVIISAFSRYSFPSSPHPTSEISLLSLVVALSRS